MTLTEFLLARIAEDEWPASVCLKMGAEVGHLSGWVEVGSDQVDAIEALAGLFSPTRVLAECEAKRRIIGLHHDRTPTDIIAEHIEDGQDWMAQCAECSCYADCTVELPCPTLRLLVWPYATHPDYQEEWQP